MLQTFGGLIPQSTQDTTDEMLQTFGGLIPQSTQDTTAELAFPTKPV